MAPSRHFFTLASVLAFHHSYTPAAGVEFSKLPEDAYRVLAEYSFGQRDFLPLNNANRAQSAAVRNAGMEPSPAEVLDRIDRGEWQTGWRTIPAAAQVDFGVLAAAILQNLNGAPAHWSDIPRAAQHDGRVAAAAILSELEGAPRTLRDWTERRRLRLSGQVIGAAILKQWADAPRTRDEVPVELQGDPYVDAALAIPSDAHVSTHFPQSAEARAHRDWLENTWTSLPREIRGSVDYVRAHLECLPYKTTYGGPETPSILFWTSEHREPMVVEPARSNLEIVKLGLARGAIATWTDIPENAKRDEICVVDAIRWEVLTARTVQDNGGWFAPGFLAPDVAWSGLVLRYATQCGVFAEYENVPAEVRGWFEVLDAGLGRRDWRWTTWESLPDAARGSAEFVKKVLSHEIELWDKHDGDVRSAPMLASLVAGLSARRLRSASSANRSSNIEASTSSRWAQLIAEPARSDPKVVRAVIQITAQFRPNGTGLPVWAEVPEVAKHDADCIWSAINKNVITEDVVRSAGGWAAFLAEAKGTARARRIMTKSRQLWSMVQDAAERKGLTVL